MAEGPLKFLAELDKLRDEREQCALRGDATGWAIANIDIKTTKNLLEESLRASAGIDKAAASVGNLGKIAATASIAISVVAGAIKMMVTSAQQAQHLARGEFSSYMKTQADYSPAAGALQHIPIVGGGLAAVAQGMHDYTQTRLGTQHIAAAGGVVESLLKSQHSAADDSAYKIMSGRIQEKYGYNASYAGYQQDLLNVENSPAGKTRQALKDQRIEASKKMDLAQIEMNRQNLRFPGRGARRGGSFAEDLAFGGMEQAAQLNAQLYTPKQVEADARNMRDLSEMRRLAGSKYIQSYFSGFGVSSGDAASAGRATGGVGPMGADAGISTVRIANVEEFRAALYGPNPTTTSP